MSISETARLNKEMKNQLSALGIDYNYEESEEVTKKEDEKRARQRERYEKEMFQFLLPLRCCWLYPKVRMPGMRWQDDPYGE